MPDINGTDNDDVIRTVAAGGSMGGLPDATDAGDTINGLDGNDTIIAGAGDDVIDPGPGDDTISPGDGNDRVISGPGVDLLDGGDGIDYLDFIGAPNGVSVHLGQGEVFNDGFGNYERAYNFEIVYGSQHEDPFIAGGPGFNVLFGLTGNDTLYGNLDHDILYGGLGNDLLVGEEGPDTLYGEWDDDVLVGGRNDLYDVDARRADDFETDTLFGGDGNDVLVIGVGDFGYGEAGDDLFEFAIDINIPRDQQPLAVGTAVFAGNRADYDIFIDNGRLIVADLIGNDGRDDVGRGLFTAGAGPQVVAFLQFADQTLDVLNDIPGVGFNGAPFGQPITLTMDAGGGIGTAMQVFDPEGDPISFVGWTNGPANGTLSDLSFNDFTNELSFSYFPNAGFVGSDSFDFLFQDATGATGSGTVTIQVLFDSAVADFYTVGVGRAFQGNVGLNDSDAAGGAPLGFLLVDPVPANAANFSFDAATGDVGFIQAVAQAETVIFSYEAGFPDGTTNRAPVFVTFVELDETLVGDAGDNTLFGYGGNDVMDGRAGNDTLDGGAGNDVLTGGPGNDTLIGGPGFDIAIYQGLLSGFQITQVGFTVTLTDVDPSDGDEGTDTLTGMERILFAGGQIPGEVYDVVAAYNPLAGAIDGRLLNTLGGPAGFGENVLFRNDDGSSQAIDLTGLFGGPLDFYGQPITQVFVNNNGNLTFTAPFGGYVSQPLGQQVNFAIIAGAWSDLDTRRGTLTPTAGGNSTGSNLVYWDLDETARTFTATWDDVSFYSFGSSPVATFQLQLVGRSGGDFDIIYRYEFLGDGRVARAGFANQNDTAIYELPGSGTAAVGQLDTLVGNTGLPGVWMFSVRQGAFTPTGAPDAYTTNEDTPLVVSGPGVLVNDADPLGRPLTAVLYSNPTRGSVQLNADGSFTYTPNADFNGTDSFRYQVATGQLASGPTTVTITVNGQNDAPRNIGIIGNTTPENLVSGVNTGTGVLVGTLTAFDPESPIGDLGFSLLDSAGGRFALNGRELRTAGVLDYEAATFHDIVVRVTDPQGAFTDQSIRIFVQNINEGPSEIFLTGPGAIYENLPPGTFIGRLSANDAEGDPITYTRVLGPVNIVGDEVFTSLSFDFEFQTQFTFRVRAQEPTGDGVERSFTIFVDNVNEQPTAVDDVANVVAGASVDIYILANDIDPDRDPLLIQDFTNPANGRVTLYLSPTDVFSYTPNPGFIGTDFFTYSVVDPGGLVSNTAIVTIVVRPGDVIAVPDFASTDEETPVFINVLSNDYLRLPNGTELDYVTANLLLEGWENPLHGSLTLDVATETFIYRPNRDFYGSDFFTYRATDGYGVSQTVRVDIEVFNVNDDPYQTYILEYLAVENRPLFGTFAGFPFIYDPDRFNPADIIRNYVGTISSTNGGTVVLRSDSTFDYTPPQGFEGYDSFTLTYNDYSYFLVAQWVENGGPHQAIIRINVEAEEPVAVDDRYTITVGQSVSGNVLANDRSPPGNALVEAQQLGGSIAIAPNGAFTFNGTSAGTYIATYKVEDSAGLVSKDAAILKIVVLPDPPPPPPPGGGGGSAWGDPHFVTFDGLYYDMQGWGEFILARATGGETFEVQIRAKPWVVGAQVTVVEAVAAAIGPHRVMAHLDGSLFVDGVATSLVAGGDPLLLTQGVRLYRVSEGVYVFADTDTGEQVRFEGVGTNSYLNVRPFLAPSRADAMEGLLGDFNGNRADDIQRADGTVLPQPVNIFDLYGLFAADWRVTDANSLFVYAPGQGTADFQVLNFPPVPLRISELPTALVAAAAAQVAAAGITDPFLVEAAILDILLTGDQGFIQGAQGAADPEEGLQTFVPPAPPLIGLASPLAAVAEGADGETTLLTFTVFRTGNAADEVSVDWVVQALGLGFTNAADHGGVLPSGTVTLAIGETEKTFTVAVSGDAAPELDEVVRIALTATPAGYVVASGTAQGIVTNDDGPVRPDAIDDAVTTAFGTPVVIAPLANDIDPLGTGIAISDVGAAANGTVQRTGNQVTYTPNPGFSGQDGFTYTIQLAGAGAGTDTATVTVLVTPPAPPPNAPPVAGTDFANALAGVELAMPPGQLLANDSDPNGDPLGVVGILVGPQNGTAQYLLGSGVILYTANAGFSGNDTIIYALSDGQATTPGIINIAVAAPPSGNTSPVALPDAFGGDEDAQITGNVLANDLDADGDSLTAVLVSGVSHGVLVLNANGSFTYTPDPDFFGADSFTYRPNDGTADGSIATVTLTIAPVNDPPVILGVTSDFPLLPGANAILAYNVPENTAGIIATILATDVDLGDVLVFSIGANPTPDYNNGFFTIDPATGDLRFVVPPDFEFTDPGDDDLYLLRVTVTDQDGASAFIDLAIQVTDVAESGSNQPPLAQPDVYSVARGRVSVVAAAFGLGANDLDPEGGILTFGVVGAASAGAVVVDAEGGFTYTAEPDFVGIALFTYRVTDSAGLFADALVTLEVEERAETLIGGDGDDVLFGYGLDDVIEGRGGDDVIDGGDGNDRIAGGAGDDELHGGDGDDIIHGGTGDDVIDGGDGDDSLFGEDGDDTILGGDGHDVLRGDGGDDVLMGQDGNDLILGGGGDDEIQGGEGDDRLFGDGGNDMLLGDAGNDVIYGGGGRDWIDGGDGDDNISGEDGDDTIFGGDGNDMLRGGAGDDRIEGGDGRDKIQGGDGNDRIDGGNGDDSLLGQAGNDIILGGAGNDFIDGGDGDDVLDGGAGNDVLIGGVGNDRLKGGLGQDYLTGGDGADIFVLASRAADRDWITDFQRGTDLLEIEAALFGAGLLPGALDPGRLVVGANPTATQPGVGQFLFNTGNGILRWDADGAGGAAPQTIVTLTGVNTLSANDFIIV